MHGLDKADELETALGPDGAIQAFSEAKKQDLIKNIGITSHNPVNIMRALNGSTLTPFYCLSTAFSVHTNNQRTTMSLC